MSYEWRSSRAGTSALWIKSETDKVEESQCTQQHCWPKMKLHYTRFGPKYQYPTAAHLHACSPGALCIVFSFLNKCEKLQQQKHLCYWTFFLTKTCMQRIFFFFKFGQRLKRTRDTLFPSKDCDIGNPVLPCAASCLMYRSSKRYAVSKSMRSPHFSVCFFFCFFLFWSSI